MNLGVDGLVLATW